MKARFNSIKIYFLRFRTKENIFIILLALFASFFSFFSSGYLASKLESVNNRIKYLRDDCYYTGGSSSKYLLNDFKLKGVIYSYECFEIDGELYNILHTSSDLFLELGGPIYNVKGYDQYYFGIEWTGSKRGKGIYLEEGINTEVLSYEGFKNYEYLSNFSVLNPLNNAFQKNDLSKIIVICDEEYFRNQSLDYTSSVIIKDDYSSSVLEVGESSLGINIKKEYIDYYKTLNQYVEYIMTIPIILFLIVMFIFVYQLMNDSKLDLIKRKLIGLRKNGCFFVVLIKILFCINSGEILGMALSFGLVKLIFNHQLSLLTFLLSFIIVNLFSIIVSKIFASKIYKISCSNLLSKERDSLC